MGERLFAGRIARALAAGAAVLAGGLALAGTAAADVQNVTVEFGSPPAASTIAGDEERYLITFDVPAGLTSAADDYIEVDASVGAPGTLFPAAPPSTYLIGTTIEGTPFFFVPSEPLVLSNGDQTVRIPLAGTGLTAEANAEIRLSIPFGGPGVQNPAVPGDYTLDVSTSLDAAGTSAPYEVEEGPGDLRIEDGDGQSAEVGTDFTSPLSVKLLDGLGDPVEGADVTFTAPEMADPDVPRGTFAGGGDGGRIFMATTDPTGIATASTLAANGTAGDWEVEATAEGVAPVDFELTNDPGPPTDLTLVLDPPTIVGSGVSTTTARATVEDAFGNPISGEEVAIVSSGAQQVGPVGAGANGTYSATIRSTPAPDAATITATDLTPDPDLVANTVLTQTQDADRPDVSIIAHPPAASKKKRVTFKFLPQDPDIASFECRLDKRNWKPCESPQRYKVAVGRHTFRVRAIDLAGNTGPADAFKFRRKRS